MSNHGPSQCSQTGNASAHHSITLTDTIHCAVLIVIMIFIIFFNALMIAVLSSRTQVKFLRTQPRILLTSLAVSDIMGGIVVCPFSIYASLFHCWPLNTAICSIEALLLSSLFHQSTLCLMCIAIDRYICIVYPLRYLTIMTRKVCIAMVVFCWVTSFTIYTLLIYPKSEFYFDAYGTLTCEPNYESEAIIIFTTICFYFPPLISTVFCYVSIFFVIQKQLRTRHIKFITYGSQSSSTGTGTQILSKEKIRNFKSAIYLAITAMGFGIAVTPWTVLKLISVSTRMEISHDVIFGVTWWAMSNSFWNPIIYGVLNKSFRKVVHELFTQKHICQCFKKQNCN